MCVEQLPEHFFVQPAFRVAGANEALELGGESWVLEDLDFRDEPVEPEADGWVADSVGGGELFQGPRGQDEPFHESPILFVERLDPVPLRESGFSFILPIFHNSEVIIDFIYIIINIKFRFIHNPLSSWGLPTLSNGSFASVDSGSEWPRPSEA